MQRVYNGVKEVEFPTALEELTPEQYRFFISLSSLYGAGTIDADELRERWLIFLAGLGLVRLSLMTEERRATLMGAMPLTNSFFIKDRNGNLAPNFDTRKNLLPEVKTEDGRIYKGPGEWLEGMTFGELTDCLNAMGDLSGIDEFDHIARVMYRIPEEEPVPDILYFHAPNLLRCVWRKIEEGPIRVNGQDIDFRIIFKPAPGDNSRKPSDGTGWTGITFEVASSGVFGDVKEVEKTDMWMVLLYLYRCKFEYIHTKKK